jgi:hypothetical protein
MTSGERGAGIEANTTGISFFRKNKRECTQISAKRMQIDALYFGFVAKVW